MKIEKIASFTSEARQKWDAIPQHFRQTILDNVWCSHCRHETAITNFSGKIEGGVLVLRGSCVTCGGEVARVLEEI